MHIVHVISSLTPEYGGPAIALAGLISAQRVQGVTVSVITTFRQNDNHSMITEMQATGTDVVVVGPVNGPLQRCKTLNSTVRSLVRNADLIHIHGVWEELQFQSSRAALQFDKPFVIRPCGMLDPWSLRRGLVKKAAYRVWRLDRMLKRASAIHFTTAAEKEQAEPVCGGMAAIIEPNGLSKSGDQARSGLPLFRRKYGINPDDFLFLFLSRIHPKKGLDVLLPAFARVDSPTSRLAIVGGGSPDRMRQLNALVSQLGLSSRVILTGMLTGDEKYSAYAEADALVLPSHQENFGNVVIEATAGGLPVMISEHVNLADAVKKGGVGEVVPLSVSAFAATMNRWLSDSESLAAYRRNCPKFTRQFEWSNIADRWNEHYTRLTNCSPSSTNPVADAA